MGVPDDISTLLYWCKEREAIRLHKLENDGRVDEFGGLPFFTRDVILREYRFCNVRRKDDRASVWLRKHVLTQANIDLNLKSFLEFSAFCRWCNWPPTIDRIMRAGLYPVENIDWPAVALVIEASAAVGKAWTGAYMIRAGDKPGQNKSDFICGEVIATHFREILPWIANSIEVGLKHKPVTLRLKAAHEILMKAPNFGSFMSGQIVADWTYTSLLGSSEDLYTWAPMGPGSIRGFNRIMGNKDLKKAPDEKLWLEKLVEWRERIVSYLGDDYADITAHDVQNALCETDKYIRTRNGEGKPRAKYTPHTY